jgi:hypothetical protein
MKSAPLGNGDVLYYDRMLMPIPQGGPSVRQCTFWITTLLEPDPVVQVTIDPADAIGGTQVMGIYGIVVVPNGNQTEVVISIQTPTRQEVSGRYFCNLTVIGTPKTVTTQESSGE